MTDSPGITPVNCSSQIRLKGEDNKLLLIFPSLAETENNNDWTQIWQEWKYRLKAMEKSWEAGTTVHLLAKDRLLDSRQFQEIFESLREVELDLERVITSRRQTAVAAATAGYSVEQGDYKAAAKTSEGLLAEPLYLQTTVRSGVEIRHPGTVIIQGDLNPGAMAIASGNILVWGCLRGIAHAGAQGNREATIMALRMEPTQLRIADLVARVPQSPPAQFDAEVAYITPQGISIGKALNFAKNYSFSKAVGSWTESEHREFRQKRP
jgi:septum site-determining protein MinC